jgi:predicted TIM-barrel fold metal-dependent hydrolase
MMSGSQGPVSDNDYAATVETLATKEAIGRIPVIDADTHVSEPPDLWTARLSVLKWGDRIPRVVHDERTGLDRWLVGGRRLTSVANWAMAGWKDYIPSHPPTMEEADQAAFDSTVRLERMDEYGIFAQVLYPNLLAFSNHAFMGLDDPQLVLECIQAYNDFLVDFARPAPERFVLLSALPFWDVDASVREIHRCHEIGHHGALFIAKPHRVGLPRLADPHWEPIFKTLEEVDWSVNFHVGFADFDEDDFKQSLSRSTDRADYAKLSSLSMLNNAEAIADVILSGLCERYPRLKFVSVESGFGWLPSFVEAMDWQWLNSGGVQAYPDRELPSFYFHRQVMGMFWFEHEAVRRVMDLYPDNVMFETDFPHPTSLSPGPASSAKNPKEIVTDVFDGLPESLVRKVLHDNAAALYNLERG